MVFNHFCGPPDTAEMWLCQTTMWKCIWKCPLWKKDENLAKSWVNTLLLAEIISRGNRAESFYICLIVCASSSAAVLLSPVSYYLSLSVWPSATTIAYYFSFFFPKPPEKIGGSLLDTQRNKLPSSEFYISWLTVVVPPPLLLSVSNHSLSLRVYKLTPSVQFSFSPCLSHFQIHWHIYLSSPLCFSLSLCLPLSLCTALTIIFWPHQLSTQSISLLPPLIFISLYPLHPLVLGLLCRCVDAINQLSWWSFALFKHLCAQ